MSATAETDLVEVEYSRTPARRSNRLELVPSRIPTKDAVDLRWFLDNPPIASIASSSFGASLARAGLFGYGSTPCLRCGGDRRRGRAGTGFSPRSGKPYRKELAAYRRNHLSALGLRLVRDAEKVRRTVELMAILDVDGAVPLRMVTTDQAQDLVPELPLELCLPCRSCDCRGVVPRATHARRTVTARPTGNSVPVGGSEAAANVDGAALIRYGRVDRRLAKVETLYPGARVVLETYYDPSGGDLTCLWLLTPGGQAVLEHAPNPMKLPPALLLHNDREAQKQAPDEARRARHARASREASELFDRGCRAWNIAGDER